MIITVRRLGWQACWSEPWTRFSARTGAEQQAAALLARDPAAHAALDHPYAVAELLAGLREAGAEQQAAALAERAAAHAAHAALDEVSRTRLVEFAEQDGDRLPERIGEELTREKRSSRRSEAARRAWAGRNVDLPPHR